MKTSAITLAALVAGLLLLGGQALAAANRQAAPKTVTVVMHDPGCHWFAVNGKFLRSLSVKGPIALANFDIAALKIAGRSATRLDAVGKKIALARGTYRITMVGQAPDDNTLSLVVR